MKNVIKLSIITALFGTLFFASCTKQDDPNIDPINTDPRAKFLGNWNVSENSTDYGTATYNCTISDSSNASYILIACVYGFNKNTYATVSGNNIAIPSQNIQGNTLTGHGVLANANQINLTYYVQTTVSHYDTVAAVFTK